MAGDISYGGGGGGGYYPPSFDPNNPMGGGGYTPPATGYSPEQSSVINYYSSVTHLDPSFDLTFFTNNFNSSNPYQQFVDVSAAAGGGLALGSAGVDTILASGNSYEIIGYNYKSWNGTTYSYPVYRVYNNAYSEYENNAKSAQQSYLTSQTADQNQKIADAEIAFENSYGNVKNNDTKADIDKLGDLISLKEQLEFQDDITKFLNRVTDSNNIARIADLQNQIDKLQNDISKELLEQARKDEIIRQKEREFFTWDFSWLTDPYFGRGSGMYLWNAYQQEQRFQNSNMDMVFSGSIYDWLAGGIYLNAAMAGGDLNAAYMPNDYYSIGLQYQVAGTDLNEGMKTLFPYDSMAGGASWGLNSSSRSAYMVLEM